MTSPLLAKYAEERNKRLRSDGILQYTAIRSSDTYRDLGKDHWIDYDALAKEEPSLKNGDRIKFLIVGAGHSGLLYAHRLIDAGFTADEIRIVDTAGGFGGTWYWNRYPGLMCDVESYVYLPLLEETGYMPSRKYAPGHEIRQHAERIAAMDNLKAFFSTKVDSQTWDEEKGEWVVQMTRNLGPQHGSHNLTIRAQFVLAAGGIFPDPKVPNIPGYEELRSQKHIFHTSRWDYEYTGGSAADPSLANLKDKVVAIIGTGATAVQVVPAVAKWAKHLYVFQRTPSHCGARMQKETDPETWKKDVANKKGWQRERQENFNSYLTNDPEPVDMVNDGWTDTRAVSGAVGNPSIITPDKVEQHITNMFELDLPRTEKVRARVDEVVHDHTTAEKLKAWYPSWCKRPTYHDDYLDAFNASNVTLVDTEGKGIDKYTKDGLVVADTEYKIDVLVLATGFEAKLGGLAPTARMQTKTYGRGGRELQDKWSATDYGTLFGAGTNEFPNLFFNGFSGAANSLNLTSTFDVNAKLVAHVISTATRAAQDSEKLVIEVAKASEDKHTEEVMKRAYWFSGMSTCTPGYFTEEGAAAKIKSPEEMMAMAKHSLWGGGPVEFSRMMEAYKAKGGLEDFVVRS